MGENWLRQIETGRSSRKETPIGSGGEYSNVRVLIGILLLNFIQTEVFQFDASNHSTCFHANCRSSPNNPRVFTYFPEQN
jgi:hypothetical protein